MSFVAKKWLKEDFPSFLICVNILLISYTRLVTSLGLPSFLNFAHYIITIFLIVLSVKNKHNPLSLKIGLTSVSIVLVTIISSIYNNTNIINSIVSLIINLEFILLIYFMSNFKLNQKMLKNTLGIILGSNALFAFVQFLILGYVDDEVQGVLIGVSQGAHDLGAISFLGILFIYSSELKRKWKILSIFILAWLPIFSDAKQTILFFGLAVMVVNVLLNKNLKKVILYFASGIIAISLFLTFAYYNISGFAAYMEKDDSFFEEAVTQKFSVFPIINKNFDNIGNYLIGVGPGHSISKTSQMIPTYQGKFGPLRFSEDELTDKIMDANQGHYISNSITGSSIFSLMFSFVGYYGDLGLIGLCLFLYFYFLLYRNFSKVKTKRIAIIFIMILGVIAHYFEEPQLMVILALVLMIKSKEEVGQENINSTQQLSN